MKENTFQCPKCGTEIELTQAVAHRLREELEARYQQRFHQERQGLLEKEKQLLEKATELERRQRLMEAEVQQQVEARARQLQQEAVKEAQSRLEVEMRDLRAQLAERQRQIEEAQKQELEWRRQRRELEEARRQLELEVARRLDEERAKVSDTVRRQVAEEMKLQLAQRETQITQLQRQIEELQQKAQQGSVQLQGETLELALEEALREAFGQDEIEEVKKGQRGADLLQRVKTSQGQLCGVIVWEAKRARNWSGDWPERLKENQRRSKAETAVIVSTVVPEGIQGFGQYEGVWVCQPQYALPLAAVLRQGLIALAVQKSQQSGSLDKAQAVYEFICSHPFRQHVEAMVEAFKGLQDQLNAERRAMERQWSEREEQIRKAVLHTAQLYGSIQGIAGRDALPMLPTLALPGSA